MEVKTVEKKKDLQIETLRGIAIILMVMAHVIGTSSMQGLRVGDDSFFRWLYHLTDNLRMPLFTIISGYIYAVRPLKKEKTKSFLKGKVKRLLIPLLSVSTLQFFLRYAIPGTNGKSDLTEIWKIYVFSYDQFWFLQAIILVFIIITGVEYFGLMSDIKKWIAVFAVSLAIQFLPHGSAIFSFNGMFYLLPCFILGVGIYRYGSFLKNRKVQIILFLLAVCEIIFQQLNSFHVLNFEMSRVGFLGLITGLIVNVFIFAIRGENKPLAWLGSYAFDIYLFHVFGQAGSRIIFKALGITNTYALFGISLFFGLLVPIIISELFKKNTFTRKVFLGIK